MASARNVRAGYWVEYTASGFTKHQILCSEKVANIVMNGIAIMVALILARTFVILVKMIDTTLPDPNGQGQHSQAQSLPMTAPNPSAQSANRGTTHGQGISHHRLPEVRELADEHSSNLGATFGTLKKLWKTIAYRSVALGTPTANHGIWARVGDSCSIYWGNIRRESRLVLGLLVFLAFCLILFLLESAGSIFSSLLIIGGNMARSQAPGCGIYRPPLDGPAIVNATRNIAQEIEVDAGTYAKTCYDAPEGADGCNFFAKQNIPFNEFHNQSCPFGKQVCPRDDTKAYTLETDAFPASYLGINAPEVYRIKRTVTCTPLNMNESFIREELVGGDRFASYYYGAYSDLNGDTPYTWTTSLDPNIAQYAGYDALVFGARKRNPEIGWTPHLALYPREHQLTVLLLIKSHNVLHTNPRTDPIFPTNLNKTLRLPKETITVYTDASEKAKALGCLESTFICVPNGTFCLPYLAGMPGSSPAWPAGTGPKSHQSELALFFTYLVVGSSDIFSSIRARLGSGLVASSKMSQAMSLPLADEQWKVESRRLFQTSLAGWSVVARDASRARWAGERGLRNIFDEYSPEIVNGLCGLYKFHATGWKNINVVGSTMTLGILLVVFLVSLEVEKRISFFQPVWRFLRSCWRYCRRTLWPSFRTIWNRLGTYFWQIWTRFRTWLKF